MPHHPLKAMPLLVALILLAACGGGGSSNPAPASGPSLYFSAIHPQSGCELWKTDGTATGTVLVKDINPLLTSSSVEGINSYPTAFTRLNGTLYFRGSDGVHGYELWKTDGTAAGTVMVKDINLTVNPTTGRSDSSPESFIELNGVLYFTASDGTNGFELWRTDGTAAGTRMVKDINPLPGGGSGSWYGYTLFNGALYFFASDGTSGLEPWRTDGTEAGTVRLKDINPTAGAGSLAEEGVRFTELNGALHFCADDGVNGAELWRTDGTTAGTRMVKDINPTVGASSDPDGFALLNGVVYFAANDGVNGHELWRTDGTEAGTVMLKDIHPSPGLGSSPLNLTLFNGVLLFSARSLTNGPELWKTDGTPGGTVLVKDINPFPNPNAGSNPYGFTPMGGAVYFAANDGMNGHELWRTDGTEAGTRLVKDINPNADPLYANSYPEEFTPFNGVLYFTAALPEYGRELWRTDGTEAGTVRLTDIHPADGHSNPMNLTVF